MNIALVVHDFDPRYGQGRYAVELARRLGDHHDLRIYANRFGVAPAANVSFQKVPAWRRNSLLTVLTFIRAAERLLQQQPHDLVHSQGLACWNADIITAHVCNSARYQHVPASGRACIFPALVCPLERGFYRQTRARHVIAVSKTVAAEIKAHYDWRRGSSVVYHGTDTRQFRPAENTTERAQARARYHLPERQPVWLFAGEATKGLARVIEQLPDFPEAMLLVISRSAPKAYLEQAARLGVRPRVCWHGPEDRMPLAYQAADIFVYPSEYDAFGLVVAEAMATGLAVVVGRAIGAAEWIVPQGNGLLCDPVQPGSLREALQWLHADLGRGRTLGQAARATVEQHNWDACAAATAAVYEGVARERRAG
jgi:UDP-glucose:(heptosyl)LPS alpha-1,3-glucosyltransferase